MNTVGGGGTLNDDADFPRGLESFGLMLYYRGQELGAGKVWLVVTMIIEKEC